jgi:hypothetical protein
VDYRRDSAAILVAANLFQLPDVTLPLIAADQFTHIGRPLGWVGYPAVAPAHLCLFQGGVSAFIEDDDSYLVDGVAINGVSGGPVFRDIGEGGPRIIGINSAYIPNRQSAGLLPGVMKAHDVTHLHAVIAQLANLDEARAKAAEEAAAQRPPVTEPQQPPGTPDAGG